MSFTNYAENQLEDAVCNGVPLTVPNPLYLKLHIGDPGEDATANPAVETTRKAVTFGSPSGGVCQNTAEVGPWVNVAATETYSHGSLWDAPTGGNPWKYGAMVLSTSINAGNTFSFEIGEVSSQTT